MCKQVKLHDQVCNVQVIPCEDMCACTFSECAQDVLFAQVRHYPDAKPLYRRNTLSAWQV